MVCWQGCCVSSGDSELANPADADHTASPHCSNNRQTTGDDAHNDESLTHLVQVIIIIIIIIIIKRIFFKCRAVKKNF